MNETMVRNVSQVLNIPTGQVPWGPIWAGLLTTLTALLLLSLFGLAVGLSTINVGATAQGSVAAGRPSNQGRIPR